MAYLLAVDLAAKYSAACAMNETHQVLNAFDSWQKTEDQFLYELIAYWTMYDEQPEALIIEDLPHGLNYNKIVKDVCRLQGRIVQAMHGNASDILFVAPRTWMAHHKMTRGAAKSVFTVAADLGYQPPDMTERAKGNGGKARAQKVESDYCAAFLIARWAIDVKARYGIYDVPGTSRYGAREIREKEFHGQDV